ENEPPRTQRISFVKLGVLRGYGFRTMVLLQPKLHLKVSQRQILTPGLVQMVSVLALNKLELKDMITAEMVENPVLEELEDSVPLLDDVNRREEDRERPAATAEENPIAALEKKDPFEEIDFGSFFQDYLRSEEHTSELQSLAYLVCRLLLE